MDGLKLPESATRQSENYPVVQLDMQFPCNIKLRQINRNLFIKGRGRTDVCLSLHLHSGQIASHSKTSVPVRGLLRGKILIQLHNGMTRCATGGHKVHPTPCGDITICNGYPCALHARIEDRTGSRYDLMEVNSSVNAA